MMTSGLWRKKDRSPAANVSSIFLVHGRLGNSVQLILDRVFVHVAADGAAGQGEDDDRVAGRPVRGERRADADLDVVRVRADREDHVVRLLGRASLPALRRRAR